MDISTEKSLYIHIPFCKRKCRYCDFPSYSGKEELMKSYTEALCSEIKKKKDFIYKTVFIGGGTPTYLSYECISMLKDAVGELRLTDDVEFTVEGNPGTFTDEKLKLYKDMGANRISIGLQAFQNSILKKLGRIHTVEDFMCSLKKAREAGYDNINVDLMFGLPGQRKEDWVESLNTAVNLGIEHISAYSLIVEEGTPFFCDYEKGILDLPAEENERFMYECTKGILTEHGYDQYEISNYALDGKECRHNLQYWNLGEYVGCGSGAHSFVEGMRIENTKDVQEYIDLMRSVGSAEVERFVNEKKDTIEEFMFMGLRKIEGISKKEFQMKFEENVNDLYSEVIKKHVEDGLMIDGDERLILTERGIELSNLVMSDFILD